MSFLIDVRLFKSKIVLGCNREQLLAGAFENKKRKLYEFAGTLKQAL